jgi:hypothetical protein
MSLNNNILQELRELGSSLVNEVVHQTYSVPPGYFESFAGQVLNKIKALEAASASEELSYLSPVLNSVSRQNPYEVPAGYFDSIDERLLQVMRQNDHQTVSEELSSLSPLLNSLNRKMPFSVPEGYFENLSPAPQPAKVVSLTHRKWFKYAVAAMVTGIIFMAGFVIIRRNEQPSEKKIFAKFTRDVKKMNENQKDQLIDFIDAGMNGNETAQVNPDTRSNDIKDVKELLEDVSDEELKDLREQTEDLEDVLMTN